MDSRNVFLVVFALASALTYIKAEANMTALNYNYTRSGCGSTKLCVEKPTGCDPSGSSECFFTSTSIRVSDVSLVCELSGNSSGYIAMAAGVSSIVSQGSNIVFVCGNNNGSFFFQATRLTNNTLETTNLPIVSTVQYSLKEPSLIQCTFTIPITFNVNTTESLAILGFNSTTFNVSNLVNASIGSFLEVYHGSMNGSVLGQPKSAFGSSFSVNLANVNSSSSTNSATTTTTTTTTTTATTTTKTSTTAVTTKKPVSNTSTSLFSHAALGLLAAVALRFL